MSVRCLVQCSFFSNTGAVAGTFTVVGLVGVAGLVGAGMLIIRRRRASQFDDIEFFEKTYFAPDPPQQPSHSVEDEPTPTEMEHYGEPMAVAPPPAVYYYPNHGYGTAYAPDAQAYYHQGVHPYAHYTTPYPVGHQEMSNPPAHMEIPLDHTRPEGNDQRAVQPSARPSTPHPVADLLATDERFSVDSFYTGVGSSTETPGTAS